MGLRQGCVLSPLLFSLFINDLVDDIKALNTKGCKLFDSYIHSLLYADDLILLAESKEELQVKIDELGKFSSKWGLVVGLPETKVMIFGGAYNTAKRNKFYFRGSIDEVVKFYTYLGVTFKHSLLFDKHIQWLKTRQPRLNLGLYRN